MKLLLIITAFMTLTSCSATKESVKSDKLTAQKMEGKQHKNNTGIVQQKPLAVYESHTRGSHFTATVYDTYVTVIKVYKGKPNRIEVEQKDIDDLKKIISKLSLKEINTYEAPTQKRFYDGAAIATISVFNNDEKFSSQAFDGGFPPKPLTELVNKVLSLSAEK